jgi:phosphoglycerate dehydrogenase-like enzyme
VVTLHLAHTPETEGLIDRRLLSLLAYDAIIINTARSQLVDNVALAKLLDGKRIAGAAIDVFDQEPPALESPLLRSQAAVLTPHSAYYTPQAVNEIIRIAVANLRAFANGVPANVVS